MDNKKHISKNDKPVINKPITRNQRRFQERLVKSHMNKVANKKLDEFKNAPGIAKPQDSEELKEVQFKTI